MGNHNRLLIQTPEANLVEGVKWLQNTVVVDSMCNIANGLGRLEIVTKAVVVCGGSPYYQETLWDHVLESESRASGGCDVGTKCFGLSVEQYCRWVCLDAVPKSEVVGGGARVVSGRWVCRTRLRVEKNGWASGRTRG
jgi:hypothetical protein